MKQLKNWWLVILSGVILILDSGFDAVNPVLALIGVTGKVADIIKALFVLYGLIKAKKALPTKDPEKLNDMIQSIGGTQTPPNRDQK